MYFKGKQKTKVETFFVNNDVFPVGPHIVKEVCIVLKLYRKSMDRKFKTIFFGLGIGSTIGMRNLIVLYSFIFGIKIL